MGTLPARSLRSLITELGAAADGCSLPFGKELKMETVESDVMGLAIGPLAVKLKKNLKAAELVKKNDVGQFVRLLPIESVPEFRRLQDYNEEIFTCVQVATQSFVTIGYILNEIQKSNVYRYALEKGVQGYTSFYNFCEDVYGLKKKTVQRLIAINVRYCDSGPDFTVKGVERFSFRQLAIMATFKNGLDRKVLPELSTRDIEKLAAYYSKKDWVSLPDTSCKQDLLAYAAMCSEESKQERERVKKFSFESGPETRKKRNETATVAETSKPEFSLTGKPKNSFKGYDMYLEELDQTVRRLQGLLVKCPECRTSIEASIAYLSAQAAAVRSEKSRALFEFE